MPAFFKNRLTRRREELRDLLDRDIVRGKRGLARHLEFIAQYYKIIIIVLVLVFSAWANIFYFNILTIMNQEVINTQAQIKSALQMRRNLVPALSVVVYQFINHEKNIFLEAVKAREDSLSGSKDALRLLQGLEGLTGSDLSPQALSRFTAIAENYPQLVSSESYQLLIGQIADAEKQIYNKRMEYNNAVNRYNTRLSTFPVNFVGKALGFHLYPYFEWENKPEWVFTADNDQGELPVRMTVD